MRRSSLSNRRTLEGFGRVILPEESDPPILTPAVRRALHQWMTEMNAEEELAEVGLKPRSRALLKGPPGCGKTTLAHHISARLGLPMLVVDTTELIDKYLGETGKNVARIFEAVRPNEEGVQTVLFLDEFDAVGKKRDGNTGGGADNERNNVVIALLQKLDQHDGLVFAATNRGDDIDPAIWRRFQIHFDIDLPGSEERFAILKRYASPYQISDDALWWWADAFTGASPALMREAMETLKRSQILSKRLGREQTEADFISELIVSLRPSPGMPTPPLWDIGDIGTSGMDWPMERAA